MSLKPEAAVVILPLLIQILDTDAMYNIHQQPALKL